jgi:poly(A) polymerase
VRRPADRDFIISNFITIPESEHGIAVKHLCPHATEVVRDLQEAGFEAYIVGGSVRDLLLGKIPKDFDVATSATPEEVHAVFPRCRLIGRRFRLAHVRVKGALVEVATFRGHYARDSSHEGQNGRILRDNVFGNVEEDALRRDFTINALFLDPVSGDIRDYVGGYRDLKERRLRLIGDPETRYREDPVRLLRAARFVAKLGVEPEENTAAPIRQMASLLSDIPSARLFEEVCKLFLTGHGLRSLEALQRFRLTATLFPAIPAGSQRGKVKVGPLLRKALENTDYRVRTAKPVTPAFLFAALLWQPVRDNALKLQDKGESEYSALQLAAEEIIYLQSQSTAIPRRFSVVTKQIWSLQPRFRKTRGRGWKRLMNERRFRAAYDFLLLRAEEDPGLRESCVFWTKAQEGVDFSNHHKQDRDRPRRRRPRPRKRAPSQS